MSYYEKYLLYKKKYLSLKSQLGGAAAAAVGHHTFGKIDIDALPNIGALMDECRRELAVNPDYINTVIMITRHRIGILNDLINSENNQMTLLGPGLGVNTRFINGYIDEINELNDTIYIYEKIAERFKLEEETRLELLKLEEQHPKSKEALDP